MEPQYPLICRTVDDLNAIVPLVTNWFMQNISLHFNHVRHLNIDCGEHKAYVRAGRQPSVKVIYMPGVLLKKAMIIMKQINIHFPLGDEEDLSDEEANEERISQRHPKVITMCPACGQAWGAQ